MNLNTELKRILNVGNVTLRLLICDLRNIRLDKGKPKVRGIFKRGSTVCIHVPLEFCFYKQYLEFIICYLSRGRVLHQCL
jgi:hypothetical protein